MAKGLKTLNPADKARKEARKKELKKNKKQRQQVRSAVIESKDPEQILADLDNLDRLEFDTENANAPERQPGGSSDILFKEKRKRFEELWARVISYYQKEDPEKYASLKKLEAQHQTSHRKLEREFEAIRAAQEVALEDVILPPEPDDGSADLSGIPDDDPLMSESNFITPLSSLKPPGCPPGPPPNFKQLVDSLKSTLEVPPTFVAQTIPRNLLSLSHGPRHGKPSAKQHSSKMAHQTNKVESQVDNKPQHTIGHHDRSTGAADESARKNSVKSAVIESKPVLFMQKATKFVPTSVRSKITNKPKS